MEDLKETVRVKERERAALMVIIGSSFETQVVSSAPERQPILLLTGMLMRLKAEERMTTDVNTALSKKPHERDSHDQAIIDSCERFLRTRLEQLDNTVNESREKLLALSALTSSRDEEKNQICSVVVTGYGSRSDAPTLATGIPRSAVLSMGQRIFLSRMQKTEIEARMQSRRSFISSQGKASLESKDAVSQSLSDVGQPDNSELVEDIAADPGVEGPTLRKERLKRRSTSIF